MEIKKDDIDAATFDLSATEMLQKQMTVKNPQ